jgi:hypothetical protein
MAAKKGTKRVVKVRPPINFAKVTATRVEGIEMARMRPTRGERDDEQKQVDMLALRLSGKISPVRSCRCRKRSWRPSSGACVARARSWP